MTEKDEETDDAESIVVRGLTKRYGDVEALKGIDFRVGTGEIVGFLGPNGAGKTTTMKILTGFMGATSGQARVVGHDVSEESKAVRRAIGYLPETVPLYDDMIVYDYLRFIAEIQEVDGPRRHERILEVAAQTGIDDMLGKTIHQLSKGYRQRLGLAQAIIHEPEVIILDEPTTGLDPNQIVEIRDVITTIGRQKTIVLSTHVLQEVNAVCDRIIIIDGGRLVADGTVDELERQIEMEPTGVRVRFETDDVEAVTRRLERLEGVEAIHQSSSSKKSVSFRLEGPPARIRSAVIDAEADSPLGLVALEAMEPTLEEVFRYFTTRQIAHGDESTKGDENGEDASQADVAESVRREDGQDISEADDDRGPELGDDDPESLEEVASG